MTEAQLLSLDAFARLIVEKKLTPWHQGMHVYAGYEGPSGYELYRTVDTDLENVPVRVGNTANPAAGANAATFGPAAASGKRWLVLSVAQSMVTAVAAADRYPYLQYLSSGGATMAEYWADTPQTASLTMTTTFATGASPGGVTAAGAGRTVPTGKLELAAGSTLQVRWLNIQAADDGGIVYYTYKELDAV